MPKSKQTDINEALADLLAERKKIADLREELDARGLKVEDRISFLRELGASLSSKKKGGVFDKSSKPASKGTEWGALPNAIVNAIEADAGPNGLTPKMIRSLVEADGYVPKNPKKFPLRVNSTLKRLREDGRIKGELKGDTWHYFSTILSA